MQYIVLKNKGIIKNNLYISVNQCNKKLNYLPAYHSFKDVGTIIYIYQNKYRENEEV
jgi:hypothetical protein